MLLYIPKLRIKKPEKMETLQEKVMYTKKLQ